MDLHQRAGNRFGQAYALTALGGVAGEAGRFEEAAALLDDALDLHRAANDRTGRARAHAEPADLPRVRPDAPGCVRPPRRAQVSARGPATGSSTGSSSNGVPWWK